MFYMYKMEDGMCKIQTPIVLVDLVVQSFVCLSPKLV